MFKNFINSIPMPLRRHVMKAGYHFFRKFLMEELCRLDAIESGQSSEGIPYLRFHNGTILFGTHPNHHEALIYDAIKSILPSLITKETFRVAVDYILRYKYSHGLAAVAPRCPIRQRRGFHIQHKDTLADLRINEEKKEHLIEMFAPKKTEVFLDLGCYLGFGSVRLAQKMGPDSRVVAVEASTNSAAISKKNFIANGLLNAVAVNKGVWDREGGKKIHQKGRQKNSLVDGIIHDAESGIDVETDTVDNILKSLNITEVNLVSITLNGAEVEAIKGMRQTIKNSKKIAISVAGWYRRNNIPVFEICQNELKRLGLEVAVGKFGRVYSWKG